MYTARYSDFGPSARDVAELMAILRMEAAERAERAMIARRPAVMVSQNAACAYEVYARSFGLYGEYTSGFV